MAEQTVARRNALKYIGLLTASAAGRTFLAGWLPAASAREPRPMPGMAGMDGTPPPQTEPSGPYVPQFFTPGEFKSVEVLAEMIIPTDDQPGAKEARVAEYIDFVVFAAAEHRPELQKEWTTGLALLGQLSQQKHGRAFDALSPAQREDLLTEMSLPERDHSAHHPGFAFYRRVKEMTVEGFYTSRVGLVDVLGYQGLSFNADFPGCTHPEHQT